MGKAEVLLRRSGPDLSWPLSPAVFNVFAKSSILDFGMVTVIGSGCGHLHRSAWAVAVGSHRRFILFLNSESKLIRRIEDLKIESPLQWHHYAIFWFSCLMASFR
jgi:hypothetical protein